MDRTSRLQNDQELRTIKMSFPVVALIIILPHISCQELEKQYSPSRWSSRFSADDIISEFVKVARKCTEAAQNTLKHRLNVRYGPGERALLDVYGEDLPPGKYKVLRCALWLMYGVMQHYL